MVAAAAETLPETAIAAVTVLTSLSPADLAGLQLSSPEELVPLWAGMAAAAGARAVVASANEAARLRADLDPDLVLITPGIRPAGSAADDQARVATPRRAIADGADVLVVGRPITRAADPGAAAARMAAEIAAAR
jgi:orotidine-5'-phosphate decarboxylase